MRKKNRRKRKQKTITENKKSCFVLETLFYSMIPFLLINQKGKKNVINLHKILRTAIDSPLFCYLKFH